MTEHEWLSSAHPVDMLSWITSDGSGPGHGPNRIPLSARKTRLYACALTRAVWDTLEDPRSRRGVEVAEYYADGEASFEELRQALFAVQNVGDREWAPFPCMLPEPHDLTANLSLESVQREFPKLAIQADILRDIAGNPWQLIEICKHCPPGDKSQCPHWQMVRSPTVLSLAKAAYEDSGGQMCRACVGKGGFLPYEPGLFNATCPACEGRCKIGIGTLDPQRLMVLSDALEEAGCTSEDLLMHLRGKTRCYNCLDGQKFKISGKTQVTRYRQVRVQRKVALPGPKYHQTREPYVEWIICSHCDGSGWVDCGDHYRGCWALDFILGKS